MKKYLFQTICALALLIGITGNKAYASEMQNDYDKVDNMIIESYYDYVSDKNWDDLLGLMGTEYAGQMESYINSPYYQENKLGVYSIEKVNSVENKGLVDSGAYLPIVNTCEGEDISIYLVKSDIETKVDNEFYLDGMNYNLVFIGTVDGERKIVAFRMPLPDTIEDHESEEEAINYSVMRFGADTTTYSSYACSYNQLPSTITVARWKYGNGVIESVDLQKYVKVVACRELGYVRRDADYHYAGILAIRNYGWYYVVTADSNANYHVTDTNATNTNYPSSYQIYNPDEYWNNSTWTTIYTRVETIWNVNFFSTDYSRIYSWYTTSDSEGAENSGRMNLNLANNMANAGKTYEEILNAFYGNSYQSTGDLEFMPLGVHAYYRQVNNGDGTITATCKCGYQGTLYLTK
ncbi:MAG: hypothetical protein IKK59_04655 [Lachnospiraceae bacterium]|nr:hypothetical protein [Lachnospiraceae bacterium]